MDRFYSVNRGTSGTLNLHFKWEFCSWGSAVAGAQAVGQEQRSASLEAFDHFFLQDMYVG